MRRSAPVPVRRLLTRAARLTAASLPAMAAATSAGLLVQGPMTYDLLAVSGGAAVWASVLLILACIGASTAWFIGVPVRAAVRSLGFTGRRAYLLACLIAAAAASLAQWLVAPFATTLYDHAVVAALCVLFFAIFYAVDATPGRRPRRCPPPTPATVMP